MTPKAMTRPAGGRSNGKSARNCATSRRSRNVSGCCAITCICLERWEKEYDPQMSEEAWNPLFVEALQKIPYTEYLLDILLSGSMEERACVVAEYGKEVRRLKSEYQSLRPATRQAVMSVAEALAPEQSVLEVRESLTVTEKGQPANTIGNCRTVFCHDPLLRDANPAEPPDGPSGHCAGSGLAQGHQRPDGYGREVPAPLF